MKGKDMSHPPTLEQRIEVFRNMLAVEPDNALANFSLGKLLLEKGDREEAERALRKCLEINPKHSVAIQLLGQVLLDTGRKEEGVALLTRGVQLAHDRGEYDPRNRMQELLRRAGVTPPDPSARPAAAGRPPGAGDPARATPAASSGPGGSAGWRCARCGGDNPRLEKNPFGSTDLGNTILETICANCWGEWKEMSVKVINEYRLNLSTEEGSRVYDGHMKEFLGLGDE